MRSRRALFLLIALFTSLVTTPSCAEIRGMEGFGRGAGGVGMWEEQVRIPTYLIGPPEVNPQFYFGGASQGAQQRIYPYPAHDNLTTEKVDKPYKMVYLENEYLKIGILPESGGKIFYALDKTNDYAFFYNQSVIKPALISLLGAWISGGVEWDVPHHHRATSFLATQYSLERHPDGSKTCWVGELELRDRMRWAVGVTLHPGKSYLEARFRVINRTPVPVSMLCFSNVAVHVDEHYQIIFPPSTQWGTGHSKRDFTTWPISGNTDLSWYINITGSRSVFAWNYYDDFLAGYDHGKKAGVMSIADHSVVPGKKFFTWGSGPGGRAQDTLLTDSDGPYIELMVGAYSDNQPDYSWMAPFETRQWSQYWYPFRDIGGAKNANIEAAVNLDVADGQIRLGFHATEDRPAATVLLRLKDQVLLQERIAISPRKAFVKELPLPAGADIHDLRASLSADGRELIAYAPLRLEPEPRPYAVTNPYARNVNLTNEELYLAGLRADQFRAPGQDPTVFWKEVLRRDPGDVRCNTVMGIHSIKAGLFADAEAYLRKALERATASHTTPKDGEPFYYLGVALKAQHKADDAFNQFARATWSHEWCAAAYFSMAQIASIRGDYPAALGYAEKSLQTHTQSTRALALQSAMLRHTGRSREAQAVARNIQTIDPLDVQAMAELWLAGESSGPLVVNVNEHPATALEAAADYLHAGLYEDGMRLLNLVIDHAPDKSRVSPLPYYYLGYFSQRMNKPEKAGAYYQLAAKAPTDYVFPYQMEMIAILEAAMAAQPRDSRAPYYLGNLLYDWQPERAATLWRKSAELGADFPVVYRNLALVNMRSSNSAVLRGETLALLEKAASFGGNAMVFNDLDRFHEEDGIAPEKRLALLEDHQAVINRDEIIARQVNLYIVTGKPDKALALLATRFFRPWEGGGRYSLGDTWVNARLARGRAHLAAGRAREALDDFEAAAEMPANLQESWGNAAATRRGEIQYHIGLAQEKLGDMEAARQAWNIAGNADAAGRGGAGTGGRGGRGGTAGPSGVPAGQFSGRGSGGGVASGSRVAQAASYYQALALQKLGQTDRARELFGQLVAAGSQALATAPAIETLSASTPTAAQRAQTADAYVVMGLGQLGMGDQDSAQQSFARALQASPDHLLAKIAAEGMLNP